MTNGKTINLIAIIEPLQLAQINSIHSRRGVCILKLLYEINEIKELAKGSCQCKSDAFKMVILLVHISRFFEPPKFSKINHPHIDFDPLPTYG